MKNGIDRSTRSDKYEYLFHETNCSSEFLEVFSNASSISSLINPYEYSEELLDLKEQLRIEFWKLTEKVCTKRQLDVLKLLAEGKTQTEIAKILNINQSSVHKAISGNISYEINMANKQYGGAIKKIKKHIDNSPVFQELFKKISDLI